MVLSVSRGAMISGRTSQARSSEISLLLGCPPRAIKRASNYAILCATSRDAYGRGMSRRTPPPFPPLDPEAEEPFYRQIYHRVRDAIATEMLKPGDRIPSARGLANELGLARGTVESAYTLLAAEGYIQARGQAGTLVSPGIKPPVAQVPPPPVPDEDHTTSFRPDSVLPFQMGLPALDAFPRKLWARLAAHIVRSMQTADMVHPPAAGLWSLRAEIAAYLQVSRGIRCSPAQIFVTSGYRTSLELISHALLRPGDGVWVEDPGFPPTRELLQHLGIAPTAVPVDGDGMRIDQAMTLAPRARAAVVTPAHQSPLGVSLSLDRRLALLDWAKQTDAWIVEDDYDGEYRYISRPLPALKSLDRHGRVLYAGTFSKTLFPGLRLAYIVIPEALIDRFETIITAMAGGSPTLIQAVVTKFMREGHFARHIQRMRKLYAERRKLLVGAIQATLGDRVRIDAQPGGMHLVLRLPTDRSDRAFVQQMRGLGLYAEALSDWTSGDQETPALLLNFTNVESEESALSLVQRLATLFPAAHP